MEVDSDLIQIDVLSSSTLFLCYVSSLLSGSQQVVRTCHIVLIKSANVIVQASPLNLSVPR